MKLQNNLVYKQKICLKHGIFSLPSLFGYTWCDSLINKLIIILCVDGKTVEKHFLQAILKFK